MKKSSFPKIMGIINVTPDSFSDGGDDYDINNAFEHAKIMINQGVDIIDIGGESTRPGANEVSQEEEIRRTIPLIKKIKSIAPKSVISIDTTKYIVAKEAIEHGVDIINDISGLSFEPRIAELAAQHDKTLIILHMKGTPRNMQKDTTYQNTILEIFEFLESRVKLAMDYGVRKIIIDVGIGFGKNLDQNLSLIANLPYFAKLRLPMMIGISRKSFINQLLDIPNPKDRDVHTFIIHSLLINYPIDIIRIHNTEIAIQMKNIFFALEARKLDEYSVS